MALMLCVLAAAGCGGAGNFPNLPQADKDRFFRCQKAIEPAACGKVAVDTVDTVECARRAQVPYSDQPTEKDRQEWLMANGCPPAMAQR